MSRILRIIPIVLLTLTLVGRAVRAADRVLPLAGEWRFIRGGPDLDAHPASLPALTFSDTIQLPGTTDTNRKGPPNDSRSTYSLSQPYGFVGTCWYERDVTIPDAWQGQRVTLLLERTKYTQCWLDGRPIGDNRICCTPQQYELGTSLSAGKHRLTLAVDNRRLPPVGADAHQFSGNTQGNWNGIIGRIELRATSLVWIDDVQAYPDAAARSVHVKVRIKSQSSGAGQGSLVFTASAPEKPAEALVIVPTQWNDGDTLMEADVPLGADAPLWDEFHPVLHHLNVHLTGSDSDDQKDITFGLRTFAAVGQQFELNGRAIFLRGKHDACVFPLTGCPPMDVDGWLKYLRVCQSYGLNHIRFHTWTPPEAAFEAADELGFYLQPELPFWGDFDQHVKDALEPEALRIISQYGNHPSFVMFSMGNEHWGGADVLASLVAELKKADSRHLYVRGTNAYSYLGRPGPGDQYLISADVRGQGNGPVLSLRGANAGNPNKSGHVQFGPPNTMADYADAIAGTTFPCVTHEMGQYTVYPNYQEIAKYTGVDRAYNLEHFRDSLQHAGMADQDEAFAQASGALAAICYREEIESCLRTPNYGGFELLDLQDYPGQGTAPVGMLDAFMESKGIITPEQWRQFCSPTVLLARFPKYTWTSDETFTAKLQLADYADSDLPDVAIKWELADQAGHTVLKSGTVAAGAVHRGNVRSLGELSIPLAGMTTPAQLRLALTIVGTSITTSYPIWIYPQQVETTPPPQVQLVRSFNAATEAALAAGQRVLLVCDGSLPLARSVGGGFATDFWGFTFFHNKPGTMGLLCDPASPALAQFPTESHSNWEWFELASRAQPLVLDSIVPTVERPIVQVIDNYERCHKLGMVFELKVGNGKLLVCATDLVAAAPTHPEARQLLASLLNYAQSDAFQPAAEVSTEALRDLFQVMIPTAGCKATASSTDKGWEGWSPSQLIDGNDSKGWRADKSASGECWCQIDFPNPTDVGTMEILWNGPAAGNEFHVQSSVDGKTWDAISSPTTQPTGGSVDRLTLHVVGTKALRIVISKTPDGSPAAINEIKLFPIE